MHMAIKGYPTAVDPRDATTMKDHLADLAAFQTKVRTVRATARNSRMQAAQQLVADDGKAPATYPVALALAKLLCDCVEKSADWNTVLDFTRIRKAFIGEERPTKTKSDNFILCWRSLWAQLEAQVAAVLKVAEVYEVG